MRRRRQRIHLRLPELSPREAMVISYVLDRIDHALWRLYGDEMTEIAEREGVPFILDTDFEQAAVRNRER
jgi:hypothetical protein